MCVTICITAWTDNGRESDTTRTENAGVTDGGEEVNSMRGKKHPGKLCPAGVVIACESANLEELAGYCPELGND